MNILGYAISQEEFVDFETFEDEEESPTTEYTTDTLFTVKSIAINIDDTLYANPNKNTTIDKNTPHFSVIFGTIDLRKGKTYTNKTLQRKIKNWTLYLENTQYFHNTGITYTPAAENTSASASDETIPIIVVITLRTSHKYSYWGGNAFAGLGIKHRNGLLSYYYAGGNRLEVALQHNSIVFHDEEKAYASPTFITGGHAFGYWDFIPNWSNAFLYGTDAYIGMKLFSVLPVSIGAGVYGASNVFDNIKEKDNKYIGLPAQNKNGISADIKTSNSLNIPLYRLGRYKAGLNIDVPYMIGLWKADYNDEFEWYDSIGVFSTLKLAYSILNIPQAITLKGSYVSNILFTDQPFHAKANLKGGFYNSYGYRYFHSRRGNGYAVDMYVGKKGGAINVDYGLMVFDKPTIGLEVYGFYDMGTVANEYAYLLENIRHTVGPGVAVFVGSPVNLIFRLSAGIGGNVLNKKNDGDNISISFNVELH